MQTMLNKSPIEYRQYVLDMLILVAGACQASNYQDNKLENQFEFWLDQLHPIRKKALDILYLHLEMEVAA